MDEAKPHAHPVWTPAHQDKAMAMVVKGTAAAMWAWGTAAVTAATMAAIERDLRSNARPARSPRSV